MSSENFNKETENIRKQQKYRAKNITTEKNVLLEGLK